jgi:hypothetical protein
VGMPTRLPEKDVPAPQTIPFGKHIAVEFAD